MAMEFILITGRTIDQGKSKEHAKLLEEYEASVAICEMHADDMKKLNIKDGDRVKIVSDVGSIVVRARRSKRIRTPGMVFIPFGPWVNSILPSETEGCGMPHLKGYRVNIEPTDEPLLDIKGLVQKIYVGKTVRLGV